MFIIYNNIKLLLCWHQWFLKFSSFNNFFSVPLFSHSIPPLFLSKMQTPCSRAAAWLVAGPRHDVVPPSWPQSFSSTVLCAGPMVPGCHTMVQWWRWCYHHTTHPAPLICTAVGQWACPARADCGAWLPSEWGPVPRPPAQCHQPATLNIQHRPAHVTMTCDRHGDHLYHLKKYTTPFAIWWLVMYFCISPLCRV